MTTSASTGWSAARSTAGRKTLELGIRHERTVEGFWTELLQELPEA
jgi:hypothetical protein